MSELVRMSMSIEKPLYKKLEQLVKRSSYGNRSEFLRDLIRQHIVGQEWEKDSESIGTITLIYDHHARGLGAKLTHIQHIFDGKVLASTHIHLDKHLCAEMIMVRGRAGRIRGLADRMRREKGVLHAGLTTSSTGKSLS
jgi:CopG family nickel-responsive transcriptional regulator